MPKQNKRLIVTRITGGLGNQMFEYAVGERIAQLSNREHQFDLTDFFLFSLIMRYCLRKYELGVFVGPSQKRHWNRAKSLYMMFAWVIRRKGSISFFKSLIRPLNVHWLHFDHHVRQPSDTFDQTMLDSDRTIYLSDSYMELPPGTSREHLRKEFEFTTPPTGKNLTYLSKIRKTESVSLHVRRTDFLLVGHPLELEYYNNAIATISAQAPNACFFVFSDDIAWCKDTFSKLPNTTFVEGNDKCPAEDMRLIAACKHHIIANSTFSWWGAYLSASDGLTLYPKYERIQTFENWRPIDYVQRPCSS